MKVDRYYLDIVSLKNLKEVNSPDEKLTLEKVHPPNIELNKFFYKNVGKQHRWIDRLAWDNLKWSNYLDKENVETYVLKLDQDLIGYFELIWDIEKINSEIAYFGILSDYIGKKYGGFLLSEAIKLCFKYNSKKVWVHTCTLDHKHALNNYLNRGMKIYIEETINIKSI